MEEPRCEFCGDSIRGCICEERKAANRNKFSMMQDLNRVSSFYGYDFVRNTHLPVGASIDKVEPAPKKPKLLENLLSHFDAFWGIKHGRENK